MSHSSTTGGESTVGTAVLTIVGSVGASSEPTGEVEPFITLRADFNLAHQEIADYLKTLEKPTKTVAIDLVQQPAASLRKSISAAFKAKDEGEVRKLIGEYRDLLVQVKADLPGVQQAQRKFSGQKDIYENAGIGIWQEAAQTDRRYKTIFATLRETVKIAKAAKAKDRGQLESITFQEKRFTTEASKINDWTGYLADLLDLADRGEGEQGSIAWFEALNQRIADLGAVTPPTVTTPVVDDEWNAVLNDIADKWAEFRDSGFDWSYRGPSIATGLYTQGVRDRLKAGYRFQCAGKSFEVGSSDTGGMSAKTEFPRRYQGTNSKGGWVKSFIYHLQGTH